jgi:hypothetical protein
VSHSRSQGCIRGRWNGGITRAATLASVLALLAVTERPAARAEATPPSTPAAAEPTEAPAGGTVSLEDYFETIGKKDLTDAQRKEAALKHEGKKVTWTGYVRAVSRNKSRGGDTFLVILRSAPAADPPPKVFIASFAAAQEKEAVALKADQKVTVSGTLSVKQNPDAPVLQGAVLDE